MNRQDVLDLYDVNEHGIITSPGKFEGEMLYVPYLWNATLFGYGDIIYDGEWEWYALYVTAEDLAEFPELVDITTVYLRESNQGFVDAKTDQEGDQS